MKVHCVATFCSLGLLVVSIVAAQDGSKNSEPKKIRVGIIGLDTSHAMHFTKILNDPNATKDVAGCTVVAAYPKGSADIESSVKRIPEHTKAVQEAGVAIVDSIPKLLEKVDAVLLETNDGRPHLEQARQVIKAGKPMFIDKPMAASLKDVLIIFDEAKSAGVPVWSSSSLRFSKSTQEVRNGSIGKVSKCETTSPASLEKTHPDLFWYGIHGVESLFTVMGTGCQSVTRTTTDNRITGTGKWEGDRVGTFRETPGTYSGKAESDGKSAPVGDFEGYRPLLVEIVKFFRTGKPPVAAEETIEIYAFMEAADESKRQNGAEVKLSTVLEKAKAR
jgi:hypothetical protein